MSFVVFLDVDGVLNTRTSCETTPSGYTGIDDLRVKILADAMKENAADGVVLTTTWKNLRKESEDYKYLEKKLSGFGIKILGMTEDEHVSEREEGIIRYLDQHPEIEEFVIIDDQQFGYDEYERLWDSFINTGGKGIENTFLASETPSVAAMLFNDSLMKYSSE